MTPTLLLPVLAGTLVGIAILIVGLALRDRETRVARERMHTLIRQYSTDPHVRALPVSERDTRPLTTLGLLVLPAATRRRMRRQLAIAGQVESDALERMARRKLILGVLGAALGLLIGMRLGGLMWLAFPMGAVAGLLLPDLLVRDAGTKRTEEMRKALPDALDLMQLCVGSGLGLQAALQQVADTQEGPVAAELGRVLQEMQLGMSRTDAFLALTQRVRQPDLMHFAHAMIQVDRLGIPIASVLDEQARDMREKRQSAAEEKAQKVAVKILGPLVVCFLPALFIIVIGPAVLRLMNSIGG